MVGMTTIAALRIRSNSHKWFAPLQIALLLVVACARNCYAQDRLSSSFDASPVLAPTGTIGTLPITSPMVLSMENALESPSVELTSATIDCSDLPTVLVTSSDTSISLFGVDPLEFLLRRSTDDYETQRVAADVALSKASRARAMIASGDYTDGAALLEQAFFDLERIQGAEQRGTLEYGMIVAQALSMAGRAREGETLARRLLATVEGKRNPDNVLHAQALSTLAYVVYYAHGPSDDPLREMRSLYARAIELRELGAGSEDRTLAITLLNLANVCSGLGELSTTRSLLERSLKIAEQEFDPGDPFVIDICRRLGVALLELNLPAEAFPLLSRVLDHQEWSDSQDEELRQSLQLLSRAYAGMGDDANAQALMEQYEALNRSIDLKPMAMDDCQ